MAQGLPCPFWWKQLALLMALHGEHEHDTMSRTIHSLSRSSEKNPMIVASSHTHSMLMEAAMVYPMATPTTYCRNPQIWTLTPPAARRN